ncbi:MAG: putative quorum-quenching lactonase YtnP [Chlamydiae bacterium]|nr:putative quorum-quenching lactonase YtnP [Chlamydiota bacterium]
MKFTAVEGNRQHLDGGAMFGNVPKEMWKRWIEPDEKNRINLACRSLLVQTDEGKNLLFDVGIGAFFEPKLKERFGIFEDEHILLKNLQELGLGEDDIDGIILSHLHFDHAGGLLPPYGETPRLLFPNAEIYLGKEHWEYAQNPHMRERASFIPELHELLKKSERLNLIDGKFHFDFGGMIEFLYSYGHTVGLTLSKILSDEGPVVFVTDLIPGTPWVHLPVVMGYDRYPEQTVNEKKDFFGEAVSQKTRLFFTHDPRQAWATVQQDEKGRFVPIPHHS